MSEKQTKARSLAATAKEGDTVLRFRLVAVFDVSQTDALEVAA